MECTWGEELRPVVRVKPVHRAIAPLVAGACVAAGILLAAVGDSAGDAAPATPASKETRPAVVAYVPDAAAAHRKQVFDERRARFDAARRGTAHDEAARR